ncbi:hypothetical protein AHAS_Ahas11G0124800 [Arachis hypogaea]
MESINCDSSLKRFFDKEYKSKFSTMLRQLNNTSNRNLPVQNHGESYGYREDLLRGEGQGNDDKVSDNECSKLEEQLMENKRTWELAKELGAMLYNEEDDIMAILQ